MSRARARVALLVPALAALASGCALVVSGLDTDFSAGDDAAAPVRDGGAGDATTGAADAAVDASAPPLPPPTAFPSLMLACPPTGSGWQLDCKFGSVVVGWDRVVSPPVLTEGDGGEVVYIAIGRDGGTFLEGLDGDGGRTVVAVADAGDPVDLTLASASAGPGATYEAIAMLSNLVVGDASAPVFSVKVFVGPPQDTTNDVGLAAVLDASAPALRFLRVVPSTSGQSALNATYLVESGTPGRESARVAASGDNTTAADALDLAGPCADFGPISSGAYIDTVRTWIVGEGSDGGSAACQIPSDTSGDVYLALPYAVDDSVSLAGATVPVVAGRVDGGASVDLLTTSGQMPLASFPLEDPANVGPLHLREVLQPDGGDDLLVAAASSTGNLYLRLYTFTHGTTTLTLVPTFGDAGALVVPLSFPAKLGRAVFSQGAYYVSLTLTTDAGAEAAAVLRIVNPGSP